MSRRPSRGGRARDLMEPLRVCLGWSETVREAAARLRDQGASAAPVVRRGHTPCLLARDQIESALLLGLDDVPVGRLICEAAPRVTASASVRTLGRRARGTAPGLIVGSPRGPILGVVTRRRILEAMARSPGPIPGGASLLPRLSRSLASEPFQILMRAGELARSRRLRLHLVGGVVRDLLLGSEAPDLDLAVEKDGPGFARRLAGSLGGRAAVHASFGTAVVTLPGGMRIDVATMRRESYDRPAALPRVEPGTFLDDLMRRDVTINAMAIRLDGAQRGRLIDELGGRDDLRAGVLRVHHLASICEDPTRAFRIARFAARFGFRPAAETRASIRLAADTGAFGAITGQRLHREFRLVAEEADPAAAVAWMARLDLLRHLGWPLRYDRDATRTLARLIAGLRRGPLRALEGMPDLSCLILMALARRSPPRAGFSIAERLRITGEMRSRLIASRGSVSRLVASLRRASNAISIVRVCDRFPPEALGIAWAEADGEAGRSLDGHLKRIRSMRPGLTGRDLEAMGLPPGPAYRVILGRLREARLAGEIRARRTEKELAARLVRRFGRGSH